MRSPRVSVVCALAASLCLLGGCDARPTQQGTDGELTFYTEPADQSSTFDRPLAVGSTLVVHVEPRGERTLDQILEVSVSPPNLATAQAISGEHAFAVLGQQHGVVDITVTVRGAGEVYSDTVRLRVEHVDRVELGHSCTLDPDGAYLEGRVVYLDLTRLDHRGEQVVGRAQGDADAGWGCQISVWPEELAPDLFCDEAGASLPALTSGSVYLDVVDEVDTAGHREIDVHVIPLDELDFEPNYQDLTVGVTHTIELFPYAYYDGWPLCTHLDMYVYIDSPETCSGPNGELEFAVPTTQMNRIRLRGQSWGICDFAVFVEDMEFLFDAYVD
jgi:hypothetical protein